MTRILAALLFALPTPCFAASQTWIVSPNPCPSVDFDDIQSAIDAAADGDTIIVRVSATDLGDFVIDQKSLTLVGDRLPGYVEQALFAEGTVRNLLAGQDVTFRDLEFSDGLILENNLGEIWIEDTAIIIPQATTLTLPSTTKNEIISIDNCASVVFTRCSWFQLDTAFSILFRLYGGSQNGMVVNLSNVHLFDCDAKGARGFRGRSTDPTTTDGFDGGAALVVTASEVNATSTTFKGGDGGPGVNSTSFCGAGGDGAPAILMNDFSSVVRMLDSSTQAGLGGPKDVGVRPRVPACPDGADAIPIDGPGAASVVTIPGSMRSVSFLGDGLIVEGESPKLVLEGVPGDIVFWGVALSQDHVYLPTFSGTSVINALEVFRLGKIPPSGKKQVGLLIGDITSPGQALTIPTQGYFFDTTLTAFVTNPTVAVVIDSSSDPSDGCPTVIYVDDDAPNDPAPGDTSISDPLEDGTLARPFDAIQEAVDSVILIGATVQLADGVYLGDGNFDVNPPAGSHMRIASENGPADCLVYAGGRGRAFVFDNLTDVRLDGLFGVRITGAESRAIVITGSSATIDGCIIEGNSAGNGAGIFIQPSVSPPLTGSPLISNCFIRSNLATVKGGGIFVSATPVEIRNCQFTNNVALDVGGAISLGGSEGFLMTGCTIANNAGGGVNVQSSLTQNGARTFSNCNIWGNTLGDQIRFVFGTLDVAYSNVQGGLGGIVSTATGTVNAGPGIIDVDPLFVDLPGFDYHLSVGSPCEDAGDPGYIPLPGELDIDGQARVQGAAIDLGSDEL